MTQSERVIEYGPEAQIVGAGQWVRRAVAIVAMLYGGAALAQFGLQIAMNQGWIPGPPNMRWVGAGGAEMAFLVGRIVVSAAWVLGGLLLLAGARGGVLLLRLAAVGSAVAIVANVAHMMVAVPGLRSNWSAPAAAAFYLLSYFGGLCFPALMFLLTLAMPTGRRT